MMRKFGLAITIATIAAAVGTPAQAQAVPYHTQTPNHTQTTITLNLLSGTLAISAPTSAVPLTLNGSNYRGSVGPIDVLDGRTLSLHTWTATASLSNFVNGTVSVAASNTTYQAVPNLSYQAPSGYLSSPIVAVGATSMSNTGATVGISATSLALANASEWSATLTTPALNYRSAGTYRATLTHSVA